MNKKTIKFYPSNQYAEDTINVPVPSIKLIPSWYKNISPYVNGDSSLKFPLECNMPNVTLKKCIPFLDAMTSGYTLCLAEDIFIDVDENNNPLFRWRTDREMISWHDNGQIDTLYIPKEYYRMVAKWSNHHGIELPKGYSMMFMHPNNRLDLPFFTFSGIVDCDSYNNPVQFPFILKKDFTGIIEAGTPICQMIPFKRESWDSSKEKFDHSREYKKKIKLFSTLVGSYKKNYWNRKSYE